MNLKLKKVARTLLPDRAIQIARNWVRANQLRRIETATFDPSGLRPATAVSLEEIFSDPEIADQWSRTGPRISALIPEDARLGGLSPGNRRAIYHLICALKPRNVLQIGTHIGSSTACIAMALASLEDDDDGTAAAGKLTTVDIVEVNDPESGPWKTLGLRHSPDACVRELGVAQHVRFVTSPALPFLQGSSEKFDFIFLDGDHSAAAVYQEVAASLGLLNGDGVILLHDYYPGGRSMFPDGSVARGPFLAGERIREEAPEIRIVPFGELPWPNWQGVHSSSFALVLKDA